MASPPAFCSYFEKATKSIFPVKADAVRVPKGLQFP